MFLLIVVAQSSGLPETPPGRRSEAEPLGGAHRRAATAAPIGDGEEVEIPAEHRNDEAK
mgnify:CR=1 FL=1